MMFDDRPAAYFSHSYDVFDRRINEFFLPALSERFALAVDPRSVTLSTMHLEMMMRRSACFIAVVTRRENQPHYRCSPFAIHEYGMAVLANRPRLVIPEINVPARHFAPGDLARPFNRDRLAAYRVSVDALDELAEVARQYRNDAERPLGSVALALPSIPEYAAAMSGLRELIGHAGWEVEDISPLVLSNELDAARAAILFDAYDFVVLDAMHQGTPPWVLPFLQARGVPTIRLVHHAADDGPAGVLPQLVVSQALREVSAVNRHALWWSDVDGLLLELSREIGRLQMPRLQFADLDQARRYVWSLGRDQGPVFLSTAQGDNDLAQQVVRALDLRNVAHFHYLFNSDLPRGKAWEKRLLAKVAECRIFVPLVSRNYLDSSWCRKELDIAMELSAEQRIRLLPYFLDHAAGASVPVQGTSVMHLSDTERRNRIVDDIDRALTTLTDRSRRPRIEIGPVRDRVVPDVDIVVLAAGPMEYTSAAGALTAAAPIVGTGEHPNRFSWIGGTVTASSGGAYQLVLSDSGDGGDAALRAAVEAFQPEHVVVLGIAVGLIPAEAVVADRICGFRPFSVDGTFVPSLDRDYPTDPGVAASADALPRVACGLVAVGGEAVVDPEAAAFAPVLHTWPDIAAVSAQPINTIDQLEDYRSHGRLTHYTTVVGVAPADADPAAWRTAAERAFDVLCQLISAHWPRPPRADTVDERSARVAATTD